MGVGVEAARASSGYPRKRFCFRGDAERKRAAAEEERFNMLSLVLMPTHGGINRQRMYACTGLC